MTFENNKPQRKERNPMLSMGLGKLPPQASDIEEGVLGAIMLNKIDDNLFATTNAEIFYSNSHQLIFKAILDLHQKKEPIDFLTVISKLRSKGELEMIGGSYYITELTEKAISPNNIEYHLRIIYEKFIQRETIRISTEAINNAYEDTTDVFDLINYITNSIKGLVKNIFTNKAKNSKQLGYELRQDLLKEKKNGLLGPGTGILALDKILKGDAPGDVRVILGATSMGKSTLACSEVVNNCFEFNSKGNMQLKKEQIPTAVFNLEMTSLKYSIRLMANIANIDKDTISLGTFTENELSRYEYYLDLFEQSEIHIDDCEDGITINEFEFRVKHLVEKHGVYKVYVDTIQLMKPDPSRSKIDNTRELQLADISRRIKACAKRHGIVIIEVAQLNDEVRKAKNNKPTLGMIRECKAIEHDADNVIFVWRPWYYEDLKESLTEVNCSHFGVTITDMREAAFIIVGKNREGLLVTIPVKYVGNLMRISDHPLLLNSHTDFQPELTPIQREDKF